MIKTIFENDDILVVDKPAGVPTHAPNHEKKGVVELLQEARGFSLGVHQRLDEGTSGVLAFSKSKRGAEMLSKAFELRDVRKYYYALVCGSPTDERGEWQHRLVHKTGLTVADDAGKFAKARYRVVARCEPYTLLELQLLTGMTHQLRVQCALEGMPILGDALYGGGEYAPRLCLHAHKLVLMSEKNLPHFIAPVPAFMQKPITEQLLSMIAKKVSEKVGPEVERDEAVRLCVPQHSGMPEVIVEKIADTLLVRHIEPNSSSLWNTSSLETLMRVACRAFDCRQSAYLVHESPDGSKACRSFERVFKTHYAPFWASEHGIKYQFDLSSNATGLYLDQRENRAWVLKHAHGAVINLFAYTCAFSLCAAKNPKTTSTLSIDAAKSALNKGRENFLENGFSLDGNRFIAEDALKYLERCAKNGTFFDTLICDPPSFGRAGKNVFSLDDVLEKLVLACVRVAAPQATLLFSINHRKIRLTRLRQAFDKALSTCGRISKHYEAFVNDDACGPLGVGTDLKTVRIEFD